MPQESYMRLNADGSTRTIPEWRLKENGPIPTLSQDLGVHVHQLIYFLTGASPVSVIGLENTMGHFDEVIDNSMILAEYTEDIKTNIWLSKCALGHKNDLEITIFGTEGSVNWKHVTPEAVTITDKYGKKSLIDQLSIDSEIPKEKRYNRFAAGHPAGFIEAFANYYYDIADAILESKGDSPSFGRYTFGASIALEGLRLFSGAKKSVSSRAWEPC